MQTHFMRCCGSQTASHQINFRFQRNTKFCVYVGHYVLGQLPDFRPRGTAVVHQNQCLFGVNACIAPTVPFPSGLLNQPTGRQLHAAVCLRVSGRV